MIEPINQQLILIFDSISLKNAGKLPEKSQVVSKKNKSAYLN